MLKLQSGASPFFVVTPVLFADRADADGCDRRIDSLRERLGFEATVTPLESIADMLRRVTEAGIDFSHPRFYNIAWMTLLSEVQPALAPFPSVI